MTTKVYLLPAVSAISILTPLVSADPVPVTPGFPAEVTPLDFFPTGISGDGTTVVGRSFLRSDGAYIWREGSGSAPIFGTGFISSHFRPAQFDFFANNATGISADGNIVVGQAKISETVGGVDVEQEETSGALPVASIVGPGSRILTGSYLTDLREPSATTRFFEGYEFADVNDGGTSVVGSSDTWAPVCNASRTAIWFETMDSPVIPLLDELGQAGVRTEAVAMDGVGTRAAGTVKPGEQASYAVYWDLDGSAGASVALNAVAIPTPASSSSDPNAYSSAADISRNGQYIVGHQNDYKLGESEFLYKVGSTSSTLFEVDDGTVSAVSNTGRVVGSGDIGIGGRGTGFVYDEAGGVRSVAEWLTESGVEVGSIDFASADGISEDGKVIVGSLGKQAIGTPVHLEESGDENEILPVAAFAQVIVDARPSVGYLAREGSGAINPEEFNATLGGGGQAPSLSYSLLNLTLHGAHHVPLQMRGADRHYWMTGDFARYDRADANSGLLEAGFASDFMNNQLVAGIGIGQSWADQDLAFGGDMDLSGQYLLGELGYRQTGSPFVFTLTGAIGSWDADIDRRYLNGGLVDQSSGDTDVTSATLRMRVDWVDAATLGGFGITPKFEYSINRTDADAFTEVGGGFPVRYNGQDETSHEIRYGVTAVKSVLDEKGLVRLRAEGVHRFDDKASNTTGQVIGLNPFNVAGQSIKQDWLVVGVDFDYEISDTMTLTSGLTTSTSGQDPIFGATAGIRVSF